MSSRIPRTRKKMHTDSSTSMPDLRDEEIESIENERKNYQTSVYYLDIVNELEKMGDFMINVSQDLYKCKIKVS